MSANPSTGPMTTDSIPGTVAELLAGRRRDTRPAFIEGATGRSVSWAEIAHRVDFLAEAQAHLGSDHGRPVGLLVADPLLIAGVFLGALAAGIGVAPLNPAATAAELAIQCRALGLAAVMSDDDGIDGNENDGDDGGPGRANALRAAGCDVWIAGPAAVERRFARTGPPPPVPPGGAALVLASSGTTGRPKIVPLTEAQLLAAARNVALAHDLTAADRGYSPLPLFHINGLVVGVLSTLVTGGSLVLDRRFSRRAFWTVVAAQQVTWLNLVPAIITVLGSTEGLAPAVRFARSASAPLAPVALDRFQQAHRIPVVETYGMTEAASQITASPLGDRRPGSCGRAVGVEVRVVDGQRQPVGRGVIGDVEIRGPQVIGSYWAPVGEQPATCDATDEHGWLGTGDAGRLDADGFLTLAGRRDDVINRGGEKIHPREIEEVILGDPRVVAAVVVGRPDATVGEEPVAFVLTSATPPERAGLLEDLEHRCHAALSRYKRPAVITVTDALPVGPTGKVRRRDLVVPAAPPAPAAPAVPAAYVPDPRFGLELPERPPKPRTSGLTMVIDNGLPHGYFADAMASAAAHIDIVKFGWGTALVTADLEAKIACLRDHGIRFSFGGTLFEKFVVQDRFAGFLAMCHHYGCDLVEVSNGTIPLTNTDKADYIRRCASEFPVVSEVGVKDAVRSEDLCAADWVRAVHEDLAAGATLVITEARESGRSGICHRDGTLRLDVVEEILASGVDPGRLLFEAPTKELQTQFISRFGPAVNLGNVAPGDAIGVETLRLGLRSDTLMRMEAVHA